jgi:hypothetical protein
VYATAATDEVALGLTIVHSLIAFLNFNFHYSLTYGIEITRTLGQIPIQPPPSQSSELQTPLASANLHTISDAIFFITAGERWTHWVPAPPRSPGHPKSSPPPTIPAPTNALYKIGIK